MVHQGSDFVRRSQVILHSAHVFELFGTDGAEGCLVFLAVNLVIVSFSTSLRRERRAASDAAKSPAVGHPQLGAGVVRRQVKEPTCNNNKVWQNGYICSCFALRLPQTFFAFPSQLGPTKNRHVTKKSGGFESRSFVRSLLLRLVERDLPVDHFGGDAVTDAHVLFAGARVGEDPVAYVATDLLPGLVDLDHVPLGAA